MAGRTRSKHFSPTIMNKNTESSILADSSFLDPLHTFPNVTEMYRRKLLLIVRQFSWNHPAIPVIEITRWCLFSGFAVQSFSTLFCLLMECNGAFLTADMQQTRIQLPGLNHQKIPGMATNIKSFGLFETNLINLLKFQGVRVQCIMFNYCATGKDSQTHITNC